MRFVPVRPPREFKVFAGIVLKDCARVELSPDEQVTFAAEGSEYDFCRKAWGYYASPSLNSRLGRKGLRPCLVKSGLNGAYFLMAVLKGREDAFDDYVGKTGQRVLMWLDDAEALAGLERMGSPRQGRRCICGGESLKTIFTYDSPPAGEIRFKSAAGDYKRQVLRCDACGHFISVHGMKMEDMYGEEYVTSTYGRDGLLKGYKRIMALPAGKSDNVGRVRYVDGFSRRHLGARPGRSVLDVGSGLCVFLARMKAAGWKGTALDPDPRQARHAREAVGVKAVRGDFMRVKNLGRFDAISFNKVLEHVRNPVPMLGKAAGHLKRGGFVYVELPDGEGAAAGGPGREEFFIDHQHVFSAASYGILAARAGLRVLEFERLREPSGKFTLRGFMAP